MKKIAYILPLLAATFFATACDDNDYREPTSIVDNYINEHRQLLTSSELGWRLDYFPNQENGAFNFLMKFREDGRVEMMTDENFFHLFEEEADKVYEKQESDYTIQNSQGPVLTFATYSLLTKLADPELFNNGSGWQGENEFVLMGHSEYGDTIYLKSVKAQRRCLLIKNHTEWDEYFERLNAVIRDFECADVSNNYFRDILINGEEPAVLTGVNMTSRMGVIYQNRQGKLDADSCRLLFTGEGVVLDRPVKIGNTRVNCFTHDESGVFHVNEDENSTLTVAEKGRPKMTFVVRDNLFLGTYEVVKDGVTLEETDLYFINTNPTTSDDEWVTLYDALEEYLYMVLLPDDEANYYVDLYDQRVDANGQVNVALARCGFTYQWSNTKEDEITFRGVSNDMYFYGTDSETGDYEANTPLALEFSKVVKKPYAAYLNSLFGSSRNRIECVVVPSPDGQYYYFVNKKDGTTLSIMKID